MFTHESAQMHTKNFYAVRKLLAAPASGGSSQASRLNFYGKLAPGGTPNATRRTRVLRQRFYRRFQARHIRDVENLCGFINTFHEPAQRRAGTEFDELRETMRKEVTHGFFPEHRRCNLLDEP